MSQPHTFAMLLEAPQSQLVLIDYQARLMPVLPEGAAALAQAEKLAQAAQLLGVPAWGTEQNPAKLGPNPPALRALCRATFSKMHFSALGETGPDSLLHALRPPAPRTAPAPQGNARSLPRHLQKTAPAAQPAPRDTLVVAGCETHVCLLQTALDLLDEEFDVCVVTDACASRTERNRDAAFDRLAAAGAELVTTEMVLFEWLRSADHPHFKQVHGLMK